MKSAIRCAVAALVGAACGVATGWIEAAALVLEGRVADLVDPAGQLLAVAARFGALATLPAVAIAALRPRGSAAACGALGGGAVAFAVLFVQLHSRVLLDVPLTAPTSLGGTAVLVGLLAAAVWLVRRAPMRSAAAVLLAALASTLPVLRAGEARPERRPPGTDLPDVTVVLIDTLRADRLGCYGHVRPDGAPVSPNIDALAARGVTFESAYSAAPWTRPSVASIFSGLPSSSHGTTIPFSVLPDACLTLAEVFRARGYRTGGFAANGNISADFGFDQGFDRLWCRFDRGLVDQGVWGEIELFLRRRFWRRGIRTGDATEVNVRALAWLAEASDRPTFTYVHYLDPHYPYAPPENLLDDPAPVPGRGLEGVLPPTQSSEPYPLGQPAQPEPGPLADALRLYDAEIRYCDRELGHLVDALEAGGYLDSDDYLVLLSDHGEEFFDHRHWGHGHSLFDELVRVPLIAIGPGIGPAGRRVRAPVSLLDVRPTLAEWIGFDGLDPAPGLSLAPLLDGSGELAPDRAILAEKVGGALGIPWAQQRDLFMVRRGAEKLIEIPPRPDAEAFRMRFDLSEDAGERTNLAGDDPPTRSLSEALDAARARAAERALVPERTSLDDAQRRMLEALGYLGPDAGSDG